MASALTQMPPFYVNTTSPIILIGKEGIDYIVKRLKITTAVTTLTLGDLVKMVDATVDEIDFNGAGEIPLGIIIDSVYNRTLLQLRNSGSWSTTTAFSTAGDYIDVAIPIKNIVCILKNAASSAVKPGQKLQAAASGACTVQATTSVRNAAGDGTTAIMQETSVGKALAKVTSGTGVQRIAGILYA